MVSRFRTRKGLSPHNLDAVDGIDYISYCIDSLRVLDLRDPESTREIGHFDTVPNSEEHYIIVKDYGECT